MNLWQILGISAGGALGIVALWLLRGGKRVIAAEGEVATGMTGPTRLTLGIVSFLVGYHLACWSLPSLSFGVPLDLWWVVALGAFLAVVGALSVDALERGRGI